MVRPAPVAAGTGRGFTLQVLQFCVCSLSIEPFGLDASCKELKLIGRSSAMSTHGFLLTFR